MKKTSQTIKPRLSLRKESLKPLTSEQLNQAVGAGITIFTDSRKPDPKTGCGL